MEVMSNKILIIDDEKDIRFLLKRFLVSHDYSVNEAESLRKGFELFKETDPEIIILDVNLPDGSGINYAKEFKKSVKVLIFISADHDHLTQNYKQYGGDAFLKKPFAANELLTAIKEATLKNQLNPDSIS